jgi:hypothetical protein
MSPCFVQSPRHSQQNSWRHCEHVMCIQPWFFWIGRAHFGHGFVLAMIHVKFSLSAEFLTVHALTVLQSTGRCASPSLHVKQYVCPHLHTTSSGLQQRAVRQHNYVRACAQRHDACNVQDGNRRAGAPGSERRVCGAALQAAAGARAHVGSFGGAAECATSSQPGRQHQRACGLLSTARRSS